MFSRRPTSLTHSTLLRRDSPLAYYVSPVDTPIVKSEFGDRSPIALSIRSDDRHA